MSKERVVFVIDRITAEQLIETHYVDVYQFCCSQLKKDEYASDVTQEVFAFFLEKLDELENNNIRAWLFSVAANKIKEEGRKISSRKKLYNIDYLEIVSKDAADIYDFDCEEQIDDSEIQRIKDKIIADLTPEERELFISIYEKKMKHSAVAGVLGISECAVSTRALRLRRKIRSMVEVAFMIAAYIIVKTKM